MKSMIITNVSIYKAIAEEAFSTAEQDVDSRIVPQPPGGALIRHDPERKSFKNYMISIVFTGMWLEALTHLLIVEKFGKAKYRNYDRMVYEKKLRLLGIEDESLLAKIAKFRSTRKELVHEKAYLDDGMVKTAQGEAKLANDIIIDVEATLR